MSVGINDQLLISRLTLLNELYKSSYRLRDGSSFLRPRFQTKTLLVTQITAWRQAMMAKGVKEM